MKKKLALSILILTSACAPSTKKMSENLNNASIGMSKQEVISAMGSPSSISAKGGIEYLIYNLCTLTASQTVRTTIDWSCVEWEDFYVRLVSGRVDSYGAIGDFDSTKIPESKNTIDLKVE